MNIHTDRLLTPLKFLLAALVAWTLADGIWFFLGGAETDVIPASQRTPVTTVAQREVASAREIAALDLFGRAESAEIAAVDAPETRLQLELQGVFLGTGEGTSSAIVAERNRDGRLFFVGDRLPGNAELLRVLEDRIVLRRGTSMETLRFPEAGAARGFAASQRADGDSGRSSSAQSSALAPLQSGGSSAPPRPAASSGQAGSAAPGSPAAGSDLRSLVDGYRQRLETDPDSTLRELGVEAVRVGDSQGYRVGSEASAADLARIGLRSGDVVLTVNGRQVTELQQDPAAVDGIIDSGTARLEIQRGERRFFVTTRIPQP